MLWISFRSARRVYAVLATFSLVMVSTACNGETRLDYHVIEPSEDATPQVATVCRAGAQRLFAYRFPAGNTVELRASASPAFSIQIGSEDNVRLTKVPPAGGEGVSIVNVEVILSPRTVADTVQHRRHLVWCDLLVVIGDRSVGVIYGGTGQWEDSLYGGSFESYESAETAYSAVADRLSRHVLPAEVVERDAELAEWLKRRDAWAFHCDPETKAVIKAEDRAMYDRLMELPKPDCQQQPTPPE
jgi:hypothetical protein